MAVAAKKKGDTEKKKETANPLQEEVIKQLEEALKKVSPEKLTEAKKRVAELTKGDLSWTELFALPPEKLQQMATIGYEQFKSGGYDRAEKIFRGLTIIDPENYYYHQMLGATFQRQEKYAEAILEYSVAVDLNQKDTVSYTNRGESYLAMGLLPLANQDFDKAISFDKEGSDRWANRARMLKEQVKIRGDKK
ncbi:MAG: tetratricopeptide repeat protein [Deltaproteobacteria bacterium]|nr:tetratricopeptide repeat protein [Deltaproteobacteria bacterium]